MKVCSQGPMKRAVLQTSVNTLFSETACLLVRLMFLFSPSSGHMEEFRFNDCSLAHKWFTNKKVARMESDGIFVFKLSTSSMYNSHIMLLHTIEGRKYFSNLKCVCVYFLPPFNRLGLVRDFLCCHA